LKTPPKKNEKRKENYADAKTKRRGSPKKLRMTDERN